MKRFITFLFLLSALPVPLRAQEADVQRLMAAFLTALQNLDWPAFRECWSDNPVVYGPEDATRNDGPSFASMWQVQFQRMREAAAARGVTSEPFTKIEPQGMRIDYPTPTVAVVTFHLTSNTRAASGRAERRRMFVLAKTPKGWKITHLNNSDVIPRR